MGCCSSTPKERVNTNTQFQYIEDLRITTAHETTRKGSTLHDKYPQQNAYLELIDVISAKYNIIVKHGDIQKIFDQYQYDGQQLIDDLYDTFDKGHDNDTLLSHILQYELKCDSKNERKAIYNELLYECIKKEALNNPNLIKILEITPSKLAPNINFQEIACKKTSDLNATLFSIRSPKSKHLDKTIQEKIYFIINKWISPRNQIINKPQSNQSCNFIVNDAFLIKSTEYQEILNYAQKELSEALIINRIKTNNENIECIENDEYKTATDLLTECTNCRANDKTMDIYCCESIKRLRIILMVYKKLMNCDKLWRRVSIIPILTYGDIYTLTQINNDFMHFKQHMDECEKLTNELQQTLKQQFKCRELMKCHGYSVRRYRPRYTYPKTLNNEDIIFQQLCDKIHSYIIHTSSQSGADGVDTNGIAANPDSEQTGDNGKSQGSKTYIGEKEDEDWWNEIDDEESKENEEKDDADGQMKTKTDEDENMYRQLVENMGIFRWQSCHGFTSTQHEGLMHLKPRYKDVKEEALQNAYYRLSTDNWNQTLRKSTVFFNSWNRRRIKTDYNGKYDDMISGTLNKWKKGEDIVIADIVILKLYTDFDKLQYELKKCFRFETISDIFTLKNFDPDCKDKDKYVFDPKAKENKFKLEERLQAFYWWRIKLITVLNKFGKQLNRDRVRLYHGVNAKMILNNGGTQRLGFYGPLSTSESYHVARTFATAKGMVLEVTTQYPRLGRCRAFDARWISDYPEEKEWLIGFVYLRILKVLTRPLNKNWKEFDDVDKEENYYKIPLSSETRSIFFAIHLFRQQIFFMSVHLEYWLSSFLYLKCKYDEKDDNKDNNGLIKKTKFVEKMQDIISLTDNYKQIKKDKEEEDISEKEQAKHCRILNILLDKFDNFRRFPNQNQVVKIDQISPHLKPYFMDYIDDDRKFVISFSKIIRIFENAKEIHFINDYVLDNAILNKLLAFINKNPTNKLRKIKFLYYEKKNNKEQQKYNIDKLDKILWNALKEKQWDIKDKYIGKNRTGYEVKIFHNN